MVTICSVANVICVTCRRIGRSYCHLSSCKILCWHLSRWNILYWYLSEVERSVICVQIVLFQKGIAQSWLDYSPCCCQRWMCVDEWHSHAGLWQGDKKQLLPTRASNKGPRVSIQQAIFTLNIPRGVLWGPQRVIICDPAVTTSTNLLLIFVCVPHQLEINIM